MSRGVEDHVGPIPLHHVGRGMRASDVGEDRHDVGETVIVAEGCCKLDERRLGLVDEDERADAELRQPRSKLGAE